ncbi:MAG: peptide ABC transporter substrate-binding protein [Deltaproteobacteria bacterium]|nr:peptide ABC transporter substrate-binding protein [Deltaproteobacteria bacterium]
MKLPGVVFYPMEDKETALKMYERGEIDIVWEVSVVKADALKGEEGYVQTPYLGSYFYRVQTKKPPLNDLRVRQALSLAIDRDELVGKFLKNTMIPSINVVPEGLKGYERAEGIGFDPERAKRLLTEAGYSDPKTFPAISIHYNTDDRHKLIAQVVQQMWKKHLGIDVKLWNEEWKSYMKTQNLKNFEISRSGWIADYPDPMTFLDLWTSDSTISHTSWSNTQYDTLIRNAMKETVTSKRYALLRQAEQIVLEEAPVIPIYTYTKIYLQKPYVKGYLPNREDMHPFKWVSLAEGEKSSELVAEEGK